MDSDKDGFISSKKIDLTKISNEILLILYDFFCNMEEKNETYHLF